jgi:hypothetical protein
MEKSDDESDDEINNMEKKYDYQSEDEKSRYYQSDNSVEYESSD